MSGIPNAVDIQSLRQVCLRICNAQHRITVLKQEIADRQQELDAQLGVISKSHREVWDLMHKMDVHSSLNAGWEDRMKSFLIELCCPAGTITED